MRTATAKVGAAVGIAAVVAAGGVVGAATASAQPAGQQVRYTITTAGPYDFDLFYLTSQPPSKDAYNADPYAFVKNEKVRVDPGAPWVFETTLSDPQWAILSASSTTRGGVGAPNAHCEIAIDGQIVVQNDHPYSPRCQLSQW